MKIGIKCEIHTCTIECIESFLKEIFNKENIELIKLSQEARVKTQYYSDKTLAKEECTWIMKGTPDFVVRCKEILLELTDEKIQRIRKEIEKVLDKINYVSP